MAFAMVMEQASRSDHCGNALLASAPASPQFGQLLSNAVHATGQLAEQAAGQVAGVTDTLARYAHDFDVFPDKSKEVQRNYTLAEVQRCSGVAGGCLFVVYKGLVLDLTEFAPYHRGGSSVLQQCAGGDASAAMLASGMPPQVYEIFLKRFVVGRLVP
nr:uncharacterized protein LOC126054851 [Helicoverpa armigera]